MELNLMGQATYEAAIKPKMLQLKAQFDARQEVWNRLSPEKKKAWVASGKDPIMTLGWQMYQYFRDNFFGEVNDG